MTLVASILIPNTFLGDAVNLQQASSISEVRREGFNHKDITLGSDIEVLKGRLEEDGSAVLIY